MIMEKFLPWNKILKIRIAECDAPDLVKVQICRKRIHANEICQRCQQMRTPRPIDTIKISTGKEKDTYRYD